MSAADGRPARPRVVVLDVNETLSDLSPLRGRFADLGADEGLAATWFAAVLREGMALAAGGQQAPFADIGRDVLATLLPLDLSQAARDEAADHVIEGFMSLDLHPDVAPGLRALRDLGLRVATLSNGSAAVAEGLLERAGVAHLVEATLSVADAGVWKPAPAAYAHAVSWSGEPAAAHVLVAVHPWDVHGAQRAGWSGAWIDRDGRTPYPRYLDEPTLRASDLADLAARLADLPAAP